MSNLGTLLKSCGRGSESACTIARKINALYAGSVLSFSDVDAKEDHPNKLPFSGTLLLLDEPSQKPPHGSQGHRILVRKNVAKNKLSGIIGMAVNYASDLSEHATTHKVGVITNASIEGNKVIVKGFIYKKDFPESEKLKGRNDLGMSMELADVYVEDEKASVWTLEDFDFTGATILKKDAAAYTKTSLAAANASRGKGEIMPKPEKKEKKVAAARRDAGQSNTALAIQAMTGNIKESLHNMLGPVVNEMKASNQALRDDLAEFGGRLRLLEVNAAAQEEDDEIVLKASEDEEDESDSIAAAGEDESDAMTAAKEEDESDDMAAAKNDDADESDDSDSSDSDATDMDAMEDLELEAHDQEPGEVNKSAKNKGSKKSVTNPPKQGAHFKGNVADGILHSARQKGKGMRKPFGGMDAAAVQIERMHVSNKKLKRTINAMSEKHTKDTKQLRTQIKTMNAQLEHFADLEGRRSVMPTELTHLAAKSGVNLAEIKANGQKLSVDAVDTMFANARSLGIDIGPKDRIAMKMLLEEQGIMDQGVIDRGMGRA